MVTPVHTSRTDLRWMKDHHIVESGIEVPEAYNETKKKNSVYA